MLPTCMLSFLPESSPIHLHHLSPYHHIHLFDPRPRVPSLWTLPKKSQEPDEPFLTSL
jgi:hypothetical protein